MGKTMTIKDWRDLNDNDSIFLTEEIINNLQDDLILEKNSTALSKRYSKSKDNLIDWIFQDDILDSNLILEMLKKDNIISLF